MTNPLIQMRQAALMLIAVLLLAVHGTAIAQDLPPRPDGPVYDGADILSPQTEASLDERLRAYNKSTGRAIIVATVPDLAGQNIEPYTTALFGEWGIGGAERDQGLLLLIARDDRKMRIEVGYGLHPYFGGIMAGRVIRNDITPRFKAGDFDGGVTAGVDAILAHLAKSPADAQAIEEAAAAAQSQESEEGFPISAIFWFLALLFFFILPMLRGGGGGKKRRYRRGGMGGGFGDIILWEAGKAVARGLSDSGGGFGGFGGGGGGGGFGGFGGGMSGGGGASGGW